MSKPPPTMMASGSSESDKEMLEIPCDCEALRARLCESWLPPSESVRWALSLETLEEQCDALGQVLSKLSSALMAKAEAHMDSLDREQKKNEEAQSSRRNLSGSSRAQTTEIVARQTLMYQMLGDELMSGDYEEALDALLLGPIASHVVEVSSRSDAFRIFAVMPFRTRDVIVKNWCFRTMIVYRYWSSVQPWKLGFDLIAFLLLGCCYAFFSYQQLLVTKDQGGLLRRRTINDSGFLAVVSLLFILATYFLCIEAMEIRTIRQFEIIWKITAKQERARQTKEKNEDDEKAQEHAEEAQEETLHSRSHYSQNPSYVAFGFVWFCTHVIGLPRGYATDPWNLVDLGAPLIILVVLIWTVCNPLEPGTMDRYYDDDFDDESSSSKEMSFDHAAYANLIVVAAFLIWIKFLGFMREINERLSAFVYMLVGVFADVELFMIVLAILFLAFAHVFFLRLSRRPKSRFFDEEDPDSDSEVNDFRTVRSSLQALYMLAFAGKFNENNFPRVGDLAYLDIFLFVVTVVLLTLLVAIIGGAYHKAMDSTSKPFWHGRLLRLSLKFWAPKWLKLRHKHKPADKRAIAKRLRKELGMEDDNNDSGDSLGFRRTWQASDFIKAQNKQTHGLAQNIDQKIDTRLDSLEAKLDRILALHGDTLLQKIGLGGAETKTATK